MVLFTIGEFDKDRVIESSASQVLLNVRLACMRVVLILLIAANLCRVFVELRGHVTDGNTQFLSSASCQWLVSCHGN